MKPKITKSMIEAGAKAGRMEHTENRPGVAAWEELHEAVRDSWRSIAKACLKAALEVQGKEVK